ncbi:UDP-N-acetylmuramyl pentapeptide phosphotransferase/UDP-N-acetylglucosamine-1-phosphate transferase [Hydrobacter penzbergensis]|uniref:UDP-N-acetylmuramyl pentapeptide phosphotransferase/UDP-N-acetylglucosamine-1-phosphate transferase n=1 Tax=Hydrobacter penzbergensis TaxID=1235997 RepID=A0A8X8LDI2_9BACT|nr:glycosyltransferase family 4 protein [Hydrobacter penzbergensis]SDW85196.1 UDP-N-acetylmuramyl pentapeptide phosphotransferase/UDP-N-acetylglucosamine-1-phosphate transferase [Hydrobacter penzbergensis]
MNLLIYLMLSFSCEIIYFQIAKKFNIIDKPNQRSSHTLITIRGGGVVFSAMLLIWYLQNQDFSYFIIGLMAISLISLWDDVSTLSNNKRIVVHVISVCLLLMDAKLSLKWYAYPAVFICIVGMINVYNFMDGINGLTALYSLINMVSLYWVNEYQALYIKSSIFLPVIASLIVFSFFNVRKVAKCFAGDVGSVSMAFIVSIFLINLICVTNSLLWGIFLGVYGIDSLFTICCRLLRKENIFQAHRSHFYQFLVNELGWKHVTVSSLYAGIQFLLNIIVVISYWKNLPFLAILGLFVILIIYIIFRLHLEGKHRLFAKY